MSAQIALSLTVRYTLQFELCIAVAGIGGLGLSWDLGVLMGHFQPGPMLWGTPDPQIPTVGEWLAVLALPWAVVLPLIFFSFWLLVRLGPTASTFKQ